MKIVWSRRAVAHLSAIREYIEQDNLGAAERIAQRIRGTVERLAEQPLMGRAGKIRGTRELVITGTSYVVPYRVRRGIVEIIAVFHGRRKSPTTL